MTGPKSLPTTAVPRLWMENRASKTAQVSGTTNGLDPRRRELEALDRAQDGDGRSDHPVPEEERSPGDDEQRDDPD